MLIEEHIKLVNVMAVMQGIDEFNDFANLNDITLYQGKENYETNTTEVIIDNRHYLVVGLFSGATIDIIKSW